MPHTSEEIMPRILAALGQGTGGAIHISGEALAAFHKRFAAWLVRPVTKPDGSRQTPLEAWDNYDFEGKFRDIGAGAAAQAGGGAVQLSTLQQSATTVEAGSECPFCPPPDGWV